VARFDAEELDRARGSDRVAQEARGGQEFVEGRHTDVSPAMLNDDAVHKAPEAHGEVGLVLQNSAHFSGPRISEYVSLVTMPAGMVHQTTDGLSIWKKQINGVNRLNEGPVLR
jgi:hypothetical protein